MDHCLTCRKSFRGRPDKPRRYCSVTCRNRGTARERAERLRSRPKVDHGTIPCAVCGSAVKVRTDRVVRYCSQRCAAVRPVSRRPLEDRFWEKILCGITPDSCWSWIGSKTSYGYGAINSGGKGRPIHAHTVSYELHFGPVPEGFEVCHDCPGGDNPECSNPRHLWRGTHSENMADMAIKRKRRIVISST